MGGCGLQYRLGLGQRFMIGYGGVRPRRDVGCSTRWGVRPCTARLKDGRPQWGSALDHRQCQRGDGRGHPTHRLLSRCAFCRYGSNHSGVRPWSWKGK